MYSSPLIPVTRTSCQILIIDLFTVCCLLLFSPPPPPPPLPLAFPSGSSAEGRPVWPYSCYEETVHAQTCGECLLTNITQRLQ